MTNFYNGPSLASNPADAFVHLRTPDRPLIAGWPEILAAAEQRDVAFLAQQAGESVVDQTVEIQSEF